MNIKRNITFKYINMKIVELSKSELKKISGGGRLAYLLGKYGPEVLRSLFGYNNLEEGDYLVKARTPWD